MSESRPKTATLTLTFPEFLERCPAGQAATIDGIVAKWTSGMGQLAKFRLVFPAITLHCSSERCGGERQFALEAPGPDQFTKGQGHNVFLRYRCRNCERRESEKTFALFIQVKDEKQVSMFKYGELPESGAPVPPRVLEFLGGERDSFFKGRRAENQGMGLAAFAYFRRAVENRKNKIFDEIIHVSQQLGAPAAMLDDLRQARREALFSKAVERAGHGVPAQLLIDGHNPLTLLQSALSEGLQAQTDEECMVLATSIRVVLYDFVARLAAAVKDDAGLKSAVARLLPKSKAAP